MTQGLPPMSGRSRAVVGIDIGGTGIKASVRTESGRQAMQLSRATPVEDGTDAIIRRVCDMVATLVAGTEQSCTILGVGVICPGHVDAERGVARYSANLRWRDVPLAALVAARTGLPVAIDHDVRSAGHAEATLGAASGVSEALYLQIGTGIAGAVISGGSVQPGATGLAGEIGHLPVVPDGELCACGQRGCTETYASASALARRYRQQRGGGEPLSAEQVMQRVGRSDSTGGPDQAADTVFADAVSALGRALVSYTLLMDPELIVFGGGLSTAGCTLLDPVSARLADGLAWRDAPPLVTGTFGADGGRVGAALIGWRAAETSLASGTPR